MSLYLMFGKYTQESIKGISAERSKKAAQVIGDAGGEIKAGYALLGETDLVLVTDFPNSEAAMKASLGLTKFMGISFATSPAVSIEEFDKLIG